MCFAVRDDWREHPLPGRWGPNMLSKSVGLGSA